MSWYLEVWRKFAVFEGRARRMEYWMFALVGSVVGFILALIDNELGGKFLSTLYDLAVFIPSLAVSVRRLHDTNRSGWWLLIGLVPLVGAIVLLVFFLSDSDPGENQYGPNPKVY
jgi:uncharacterized membrane protein YhaH (DUF805 family)